jgi:hypothetical protein
MGSSIGFGQHLIASPVGMYYGLRTDLHVQKGRRHMTSQRLSVLLAAQTGRSAESRGGGAHSARCRRRQAQADPNPVARCPFRRNFAREWRVGDTEVAHYFATVAPFRLWPIPDVETRLSIRPLSGVKPS